MTERFITVRVKRKFYPVHKLIFLLAWVALSELEQGVVDLDIYLHSSCFICLNICKFGYLSETTFKPLLNFDTAEEESIEPATLWYLEHLVVQHSKIVSLNS